MGRFTGVIGIIVILGLAFLWSNNRKKINYRLVITGLLLQVALAIFILKVPIGQDIFYWLGKAINKLLDFSREGGYFVFGDLTKVTDILPEGLVKSGVFLFILLPTIIFVCVLVAMAYHIGLMQRVIALIARFVHWAMRVSGSEALSNVASAFVGQVEAQIMIRPYLSGMTMSELLASMAILFNKLLSKVTIACALVKVSPSLKVCSSSTVTSVSIASCCNNIRLLAVVV